MHSFQIENKAQDAASSLTAQGYHAYIKEVDLGAKGIWYRVMVGDFSSSQEAQEKLNELKKIKEDGFVVKLP
jgi:cell division septation protein DedD